MKRKLVFYLMAGILLMPNLLSVSLQAQENADAQPPVSQRRIDVYNVKELVANKYNDPKVWMDHLELDLMKFWKDKADTTGKSSFFATFRANDGTIVSGDVAGWPQEYRDALYAEDANGLVADAGKYNYIRAHSRQTFAYGIAFNMTGNVDYLNKCRQGAMAILKAMDENNGLYNKQEISTGKWMDPRDERNSQDLAYGITGLGFYYYLTHDQAVLEPLLAARKYIFETYFDPGKDFLTWLPKDVKKNNSNVEIVSQLDQLYAYMLWVTPALPEPYQTEWKADLKKLANVMINHFYSARYGTFWGSATNDLSKELGTDHTDFGHSVKAMWVIYEIGKITNDLAYVDFAREKIKVILNRAYIKKDGTWARRYNQDGTLDIDKEWWGLAELDQAAAILSLNDPSYLRFTNNTYKYWFDVMVDKKDGEIWHMVDGKTNKPVLKFPKIHAWKTSLHSFEHCFLGYMISSYHRDMPFHLYYAFMDNEQVSHKNVNPYFLQGNIEEFKKGESVILNEGEQGRRIWDITFNYLH